MSVHMKMRPTENRQCKVIIITPNFEKTAYISNKNVEKLEVFLEKCCDEELDKPVAWEELAKDRIQKYKKSGLFLRGIRYREGISQRQLAEKSHVSQNEISKIENGKRTIGQKVAKRLARALHIDYRLLLNP